MARLVFAGDERHRDVWEAALRRAMPDAILEMDPARADPAATDILLYEPTGPLADLSPYAGVAAIQNLWAGVEKLLANPTLPAGPAILRMVEDGLTRGMCEYVLGHAMRLHLGIDAQRLAQAHTQWNDAPPPLASGRCVGFLGLGALGQAAARTLVQAGFEVLGWSRTAKSLDGVESLTGADGFAALLERSDILVLLAPLTPETDRIIDAAALARMQPGAHLINAARGELIDDAALLAALDTGTIASATLDVFREEPLQRDHPYWCHPSVTVTPHIASATRPETAAKTIADQVQRYESGRPFAHVVDPARGY